ncbi:MAG: hypothetical protein M3Y87_03840 [Myxococcota bacterium]|nr:hypothetical protein [Myxococcota bacterium]
MTYQPLQPDLFRFLLPVCLDAWAEDLQGRGPYAGFVEQLYPALVRSRCLDTMLDTRERDAVYAFLRAAILEVIDREQALSFSGMHASPYRWIAAFTTHGVLAPDVDALWTEWWSLATSGRAVAALQYASCLAYDASHDPVFAPWTRDGGGGPPTLWDYAGHLYEDRWRPENVAFLERTLGAEYVLGRIDAAVEVLRGAPTEEAAAMLRDDLPAQRERLEHRCAELPRLLATPGRAGELRRWSA